MDQNGTNLPLTKYTYKKELYFQEIKLNNDFRVVDLFSILILLDKYYEYLIEINENEISDWHDVIYPKNILVNNVSEYKLIITPKLYFIKSGIKKSDYIKDAFKIVIIPSNNYLLFDLYANLFTNISYELDDNHKYYKIDQSEAALRNRENLTNFLKDLEIISHGTIEGFYTVYHLTDDSIFKYGITEHAKLIEEDYRNL